MKNKISVLLADDNVEFVELFSDYLAAQPDFEVLGTASNGHDAYEQIMKQAPDVILLDIIMPELDGLGLLRKLNEQCLDRRPNIIILSAVAREEVTREALLLGVDYYIIKPFDLETVAERIRTFCSKIAEEEYKPQRYDLAAVRNQAVKDLESKTTRFLLEIGIPPDIQGFSFIRDCVLLQCNCREYADLNSHFFYYTLASQYHTTPVCIERAIQYAKSVACKKNTPEKDLLFKYCNVKRKKIPSNMEMIRAISDRIKK